MDQRTLVEPLTLDINSMPRLRILAALRAGHVQLNDTAATLFGDSIFDQPRSESITVVEHSVSELGLVDGAVLAQIFAAAQDHGLRLCPPTTAPYLRLVLRSQATAPDAVMSNGKAPSGSLTVASAALRVDEDYPKGFYLRVINGSPWLRGYHCGSTEHVWDPGDRFVFSQPLDDGSR